MKAFEYIINYYGVPACIGRKVVCSERPGIIVEDKGQYLGVVFDDDKPNLIYPVHPTSNVEYKGMGIVRKMTPSQKRYKDFLKLDTSLTFKEYLKAVK